MGFSKLKREPAVMVSLEETDAIPPSPPMEPVPADDKEDAVDKAEADAGEDA
jgi:hypothetical protein